MNELHFLPAIELAAMLRSRKVSSRELLEHFVDRVENYNPALNAIVSIDLDRARRRAGEADAALARGEIWGPLHGLPATIKDTFETAGLLSTWGNPDFAGHIPEYDSPAVARVRGAGAVIFGKTNVPLNGMDMQTYNEIFGVTSNPWDLERSPGGSSGGTAAALAAGITGLDIGSDIGGSIRNPAHYAGLYGHKPTYGIVPFRRFCPPGIMPVREQDVTSNMSVRDLVVAGPLGRSIEDVEMMLHILAGPEWDAAPAWRLELPPPRSATLRGYRMAAWLDDGEYPVDGAVARRLRAVVDALRAAGVEVDEEARPEGLNLRSSFRVFVSLLNAASARGVPPGGLQSFYQLEDRIRLEDDARQPEEVRTYALRHRDWLLLHEEREQLRYRWHEFFRKYDVLLCPVTPVTAIRHDHSPFGSRRVLINGKERPYLDLLSWMGFGNMTYLPATVAPVGLTEEHLPCGIQIVGPYLEDRTTIDVARKLSEIIGGFQSPPSFS